MTCYDMIRLDVERFVRRHALAYDSSSRGLRLGLQIVPCGDYCTVLPCIDTRVSILLGLRPGW
jgi:hypothetical protein